MFILVFAALCLQACLVQYCIAREESSILDPIEDLIDTQSNGPCLEELLNVPENVLGLGRGDVYGYGAYDYAPGAWPCGPFAGYAIPYAYYAREPLPLTAFLTGRLSEPFAKNLLEAYGGNGVGEVAVAGDLPSAGTTAVTGLIPIVGAIEFGGQVSAAGSVTITGSCGCGCAGPLLY